MEERELDEHEQLLAVDKHLELADIELRNALRAALDDNQLAWTIERLAKLIRQVNELAAMNWQPRVAGEEAGDA